MTILYICMTWSVKPNVGFFSLALPSMGNPFDLHHWGRKFCADYLPF